MTITRICRSTKEVLKSGSNINDMESGELWWGNNFTNSPDGTNGWFSIDSCDERQIAMKHVGNTKAPQLFVRSHVNGVWQPWNRFVGASEMFYLPGDTITVSNMGCSGLYSSGRTVIRFSIPLAKLISGTVAKTASTFTISVRGIPGGYLLNQADANDTANVTDYEITYREPGQLDVYCVVPANTSFTNNTPVSCFVHSMSVAVS